MPGIVKHQIITALSGGPTSSGVLAENFGVSRQAIHYHLKALAKEGQVRRIGQGRGAKWERNFGWVFRWDLQPPPGEDLLWNEAKQAMGAEMAEVTGETKRCLSYGVTEMLNNAIDHSGGTAVELAAAFDGGDIEIVISDDGVGALQKVRAHFSLPTEMDAIVHIAKGRQTTAPVAHSGQGLFFTSKIFDTFELDSGAHRWKVDNVRGDQTVAVGSGRRGTQVALRIARHGTRVPKDVFDDFSDPETYDIDRSRLRVSLADHGTEFMSRSEAKRLASGLELYGKVTLDFAGVTEVGQGFVDELFRVWPAANPGTDILPINASPEVAFMIKRGLPNQTASRARR